MNLAMFVKVPPFYFQVNLMILLLEDMEEYYLVLPLMYQLVLYLENIGIRKFMPTQPIGRLLAIQIILIGLIKGFFAMLMFY